MAAKKQEQDTNQLNQLMTKVVNGELNSLNSDERYEYYKLVCESIGLNPLTLPLGYMTNKHGALTLYAKKEATEQLSKIYGVSVGIKSRETIMDTFVVVASATEMSSGRSSESLGAVTIKGLGGENLANAMMKAETKAKRRAILSLIGLGCLDESEVDDIPDGRKINPTTMNSDNGDEKATPAITVNKPQKPEQKPEPKPQRPPRNVTFCIKQKAIRENKNNGREYYVLQIQDEAGNIENAYVLSEEDIKAVNVGLDEGSLSFKGTLKYVNGKGCLEALEPISEAA